MPLRRKKVAIERNAAEHAAYFARIRLLGQRPVSTREAAALARVSVRTIQKWRRRGLLEGRKDAQGRNWYREADVMAAEFRVRGGLRRPLSAAARDPRPVPEVPGVPEAQPAGGRYRDARTG